MISILSLYGKFLEYQNLRITFSPNIHLDQAY